MKSETDRVLFCAWIVIICLLVFVTWQKRKIDLQEIRIEKLEQVCHGQCNYGDAECAKRCQKAGHCDRD